MSIAPIERRRAAPPPARVPRGAFAPPTATTLAIGLIGPGNVGRAFLAQWTQAAPRLRAQGVDLVLRGVADRRRMWLGATRDRAAAVLGDAPRPPAHLNRKSGV